MKKTVLAAAVIISALSTAASAQPKSVGGRLAFGLEASYQHTVRHADFIEANLGVPYFSSLSATATYNFMIAQPVWTARGDWGFYAGPGLSVGYAFSSYDTMIFGIVGQIGLEYSFWFPLQISVDLRPQFGIGYGAGFYNEGLLGFIPTVGVRYRF